MIDFKLNQDGDAALLQDTIRVGDECGAHLTLIDVAITELQGTALAARLMELIPALRNSLRRASDLAIEARLKL